MALCLYKGMDGAVLPCWNGYQCWWKLGVRRVEQASKQRNEDGMSQEGSWRVLRIIRDQHRHWNEAVTTRPVVRWQWTMRFWHLCRTKLQWAWCLRWGHTTCERTISCSFEMQVGWFERCWGNRQWRFEVTVCTHIPSHSCASFPWICREVYVTNGEMVCNDLLVTSRLMELVSYRAEWCQLSSNTMAHRYCAHWILI